MEDLKKWQTHFENWWLTQGEGEDASHDLGHFRRVYKLCCDIAAGEGSGDLLILLAGAYFHDVVNIAKDSPLRSQASRLAAEKASKILIDMNYPAEKIPQTCHVIEAHSFSANILPESLEAEILQDADRMEALGAIGICRNMYVSGRMGTKLFDAEDPLAHNRALNDKKYALDHFKVKLFKLPAMMRTRTGRKIAEERAEFLSVFQRQLLREITL